MRRNKLALYLHLVWATWDRLLCDRVSGAYEMSSLADLIAKQAEELQLGGSWHTP